MVSAMNTATVFSIYAALSAFASALRFAAAFESAFLRRFDFSRVVMISLCVSM
jgi:hypothetical protein